MVRLCDELIEDHEPVLFAKIGSRKMMLMEDVEIFKVKIKRGYITNGASVPRIFFFILDPFGESLLPALVHDYRYTNGDDKNFTRSQADWEFFTNLGKFGINIFRRTAAYLAVRCFGWMYWYSYRNKLSEEDIRHLKDQK